MRLVLLLLVLSFSLKAKPLQIETSARSAILMNVESGAVLYEKNSRDSSYPASVTKTATLLYILENQKLPFDKLVKVTPDALKGRPSESVGDPHWLIPDGTMMGLKKGEEVSVEALLHGLMLISGNDAANVLAEACSGSVPQFVEELNQYLRNEVGCSETQFANPHGIHNENHHTSAYDLCLIAQRGLKIPKFREIVSTMVYKCPQTNKRPSFEIRQSNALLKQGKHYYSKAIGVKTGFHSNARNTLIAAAEHEGRTLVAVLMGCAVRGDRYKDAIALFEAAFNENLEQRVIMDKDRVFNRVIEGAEHPLQSSLLQDLEISFYPAEEPECKAFVRWETLTLPIKKDQKVGEVQLFDQRGRMILSRDLIAKQDVKATLWHSIKEQIRKLL